MTNEREGWGEDGSQLVIHNQLVTLELPDLPRFGVVSNESCTAKQKDFRRATKNIAFEWNDMLITLK